jgi:hypothetical protein
MSVYLWPAGGTKLTWPDPDADSFTKEVIVNAGMQRTVHGNMRADYGPYNYHRWSLKWTAIAGNASGTAWAATYGVVFDYPTALYYVGNDYDAEYGTYTVTLIEGRILKPAPGCWGAEIVIEEM